MTTSQIAVLSWSDGPYSLKTNGIAVVTWSEDLYSVTTSEMDALLVG